MVFDSISFLRNIFLMHLFLSSVIILSFYIFFLQSPHFHLPKIKDIVFGIKIKYTKAHSLLNVWGYFTESTNCYGGMKGEDRARSSLAWDMSVSSCTNNIHVLFSNCARFFQNFSEFQVLHFCSICFVHFSTCHIWVIYITRTALLQSFHCLTFLFLGKAHAAVLSYPRLLEEMAWSVHKLIKFSHLCRK